ncbi:hypothetical protein [Prosthecobacter sp.]|uniref:hypothetical protein n=1 Tax=Prosthecobacter sp. TaxID=1965333 RepID=UPI00378422B5
MKVFVTSDSNWEAKLDHALKVLSLREHFEGLDFGSSLSGLCIVMMCRDPELQFKQRIRMDRKTHDLYLDVMLPLPSFVNGTHAERRHMAAMALVSEVPAILKRYKLKDFRIADFVHEFETTVRAQLLGPDSSRYDHLCLEKANLGN